MRPELHLLRRIARVPAGTKLPIGQLARQLNATQAVTLDMIAWLVRAGRLDAATLRPTRAVTLPVPPSGRRSEDVAVGEIIPLVRRFLAITGMPKTTFGRECMRDPRFVHSLLSGERESVRASTAERVRAFIAEREDAIAGVEHPPAFVEQLGRVGRGEVGLTPAFHPRRAMPEQTLGGVTGEIN